jgi:hypothetical protein
MGKRVLAVDAYDVIDIFLKLGVSFEDIASLEFHFEDEPDRRLTAEFIAAWYEEEKRERAPARGMIGEGKKPKG